MSENLVKPVEHYKIGKIRNALIDLKKIVKDSIDRWEDIEMKARIKQIRKDGK